MQSMKRFLHWLKNLFFPPPHSTVIRRILPFVLVAVIILVAFMGTMLGWDATNGTVFCGTACHTMPPEYSTQQLSAHANITCEDCHLGRAPIFEEIGRKLTYSWQTGTAMLFNTYTYPIFARNMRPANDACLPCHDPEKFSGDKLVQLKEYAQDEKNTETMVSLILKIEGGTQRAGLGYGIHWHIENPVYYYATDAAQQNIPYVRVDKPDGTSVEYIDSETLIDPKTIDPSKLQRMDCITCHNRVAHNIDDPETAVNDLVSRGQISQDIPDIVKKSMDALSGTYTTFAEADLAIRGIAVYYQQMMPDFYAKNTDKVTQAIESLRTYYYQSEFFDQKVDWTTHPNNIGHDTSAGCFRCHDGKHVSAATNTTIRLECNLCHSIPVITNSTALVTDIQVGTGEEPVSHTNSNWISLHNQAFDASCAGCHTVGDPGGTSNTSFCSNSECHGESWTYAGFNAPKLRTVLAGELSKVILPTPTPGPTTVPQPTAKPSRADGKLSWPDISALFDKCTACHIAGGTGKGSLDLTSYAGIMKGGKSGPAIVPGDPANSLLVQKQTALHSVNFTAAELAQIVQWIKDGALEK
jgi:nitrate/TMAO reductase-like tetraheme cytochrome c subunit